MLAEKINPAPRTENRMLKWKRGQYIRTVGQESENTGESRMRKAERREKYFQWQTVLITLFVSLLGSRVTQLWIVKQLQCITVTHQAPDFILIALYQRMFALPTTVTIPDSSQNSFHLTPDPQHHHYPSPRHLHPTPKATSGNKTILVIYIFT